MMNWLFVFQFLILLLIMMGYLKVADRFNIIDKPNQRSSHKQVTIRGGGIIFPVAVLSWFLSTGFTNPWFTVGLLLIAGISFLDDLYSLSTRPRLLVHLVSVGLLLFELGWAQLDWYWWLLAIILIMGWINAFNFMDGINGITALYALSVLCPLYVLNENLQFTQSSLLLVSAISLLIFAFFNARKKARCFAGDVGSVSMAFILAFLTTALIKHSGHWEYILLLSVYGVDAVLTIIHRLIKRENIFKAHRSHLYQYLANEMGWGHVPVAIVYACLQLAVSFLMMILIDRPDSGAMAFVLMGLLLVVYVGSKTLILQRLKSQTAS